MRNTRNQDITHHIQHPRGPGRSRRRTALLRIKISADTPPQIRHDIVSGRYREACSPFRVRRRRPSRLKQSGPVCGFVFSPCSPRTSIRRETVVLVAENGVGRPRGFFRKDTVLSENGVGSLAYLFEILVARPRRDVGFLYVIILGISNRIWRTKVSLARSKTLRYGLMCGDEVVRWEGTTGLSTSKASVRRHANSGTDAAEVASNQRRDETDPELQTSPIEHALSAVRQVDGDFPLTGIPIPWQRIPRRTPP